MMLVAIEELSKVCATTGLILAVQALGAIALELTGSEEQKQRYLPRLVLGRVARRVRADGAGIRVRLGGDADDGPARQATSTC